MRFFLRLMRGRGRVAVESKSDVEAELLMKSNIHGF
jgi:hypothetical protein